MATPKFNSKSPTIKRILKEAAELSTTPSPDYHATPATDADLFDWHFTIRGPPSTPYSTGIYHGRIVLPSTYPLRPPSFRFLTPSGRFEVNREICLSISGHHEETWQPAWGIRTALVALRAFMEGEAKGQLGGLECSVQERERLAGLSAGWSCGICGRSNAEVLKESEEAWREMVGVDAKIEEVEVPGELKMGYGDQMKRGTDQSQDVERSKSEAESPSSVLQEESEEEAELAEGFVTTRYPAAQPGQGVAQPTGTTQVPIPSRTQAQNQTQPQAQITPAPRLAQTYHEPTVAQVLSNEGVPAWVDRSIAVVVACLVAMILKILIGL